MSALLHPPLARAEQDVELVLLHETSGDAPPDVVELIDARLVDALATRRTGRGVYVSPVRYPEVQLAVGCSDETPACLTQVARTARANVLVIRHLWVDESRTLRLRILYFDRSRGHDPVHVELSATYDRRAQLAQSIASAVDRLLDSGAPRAGGPSAPLAPLAPRVTATGAAPAGATVSPATWIVIGTGAALTATGIALGVSANADYADFRRSEIDTPADADRAHREFGALETRATWATALIPTGVLAMGIGGVLLGLDLTDREGSTDIRGPRAFVVPLRGGAAVGFEGALDR